MKQWHLQYVYMDEKLGAKRLQTAQMEYFQNSGWIQAVWCDNKAKLQVKNLNKYV